MDNRVSIAIDGPSGAGKSTLARLVAEHFGLVYIDTGAIYRAVGLKVLREGISTKDERGIKVLLAGLNLSLRHDPSGVQRIFLDGEDVSDAIRAPEISIYASDVSAMPTVRKFLLNMQRAFAEKYNVVMDGRDIGTVVLPEASLKIFLTASEEERAHRRYEELVQKGVKTSFDHVLRDIQYRDKNDSTRAEAPLRPAVDAIILDTTGNSLDMSYRQMIQLIKEKFSGERVL